MFEQLIAADNRGELMLLDSGFCRWHLRNDGQITIYEIVSQQSGTGAKMLERLKRTPGATTLFAKCPANLPANNWYSLRGFHVERMETLRSGRKVLHWRMKLDSHQPTPRRYNGVELLFSNAANKRFAELAIDAGWEVGVQLPRTAYFQPYFTDQNFHDPNFARYLEHVQKHRPYVATVLDIETWHQLDIAMQWAKDIEPYVQEIMFIPKVSGVIARLPRDINGKRVRLGYSVPTRHGGTDVAIAEFQGWPVHLLGGSPQKQLALLKNLDVVSIDQLMIQERSQACQFWTPQPQRWQRNQWFPQLSEAGIHLQGKPAQELALKMSLENFRQALSETKQPEGNIYNGTLFEAIENRTLFETA